ncbi:MAG TPA: VOC family protein [Streptosporangiaceae bacterium]|nr:VOC family protein [Streptosporangiaceae bacterium]
MAGAVDGLHFGVVGVTDVGRALDFYCGLLEFTLVERQPGTADQGDRCRLASDGRFLVLQELRPGRGEPGWVNDDLQAGMRHIGLKVDDIDAWAERVRSAGARFTLEPTAAFGDVRICFFLDPDGAHLEFIQGDVNYTSVTSPDLVEAERAAPVPATPRFDHVAVSVADLGTALGFYTGHLGFPVLGQLREDDPERGFTITYLQAGPGILEIFSFSEPLLVNSFNASSPAPGLLHLGLAAADVPAAVAHLLAGGATLLGADGAQTHDMALLTDADGTPLEVSSCYLPRAD